VILALIWAIEYLHMAQNAEIAMGIDILLKLSVLLQPFILMESRLIWC
jgi:hypothetical protein